MQSTRTTNGDVRDTDAAALRARVRKWMEAPAVDLESPCTFTCQGCGWRCCSNRNDILVTPYSMLRIAWWIETLAEDYPSWSKHLSKLFLSSFIIQPGGTTRVPLARLDFKPLGANAFCPFLVPANAIPIKDTPTLIQTLIEARRGRSDASPCAVCGIYPVRPNACRLFPLGRIGKPEASDVTAWKYFLQDVPCGQRGQRADGLTWGEWIGADEQAQHAAGLDLYLSMAKAVRQQLADAGVRPDEWLANCLHQRALQHVFYSLPVPPREQRTSDTALAVCQTSAALLPHAIEALLRSPPTGAGELAVVFQDVLERRVTGQGSE